MWRAYILTLAFACGEKTETDSEESFTVDGIQIPDSTSDGQCPDMTQSHTTSFSSSGQDRVVTTVIPDQLEENMPFVYFFHGLLDPGYTPKPTE